ncbi:SAM-dependent methyltransferase [Rugosimonospora africana]|uniref:S-adenosyl methyltransferase n=1 Tax=Rugosimonospora africana TaxID=556532 RepID=A0A8J3VTZ0_9ACTN|nr:SAM-dependent methyltransferase [Rugosimonospora africana]GIH18519.1 hypothetical protein Raf01_66910 [Rugosimonospora africana]
MPNSPHGEQTARYATAARMYDCYLGGVHNFPADQEAAREVMARLPGITASAHANRAFLARAVDFLVGAGVRQFLDFGAGIPAQGSVRSVSGAAIDARAVFVDIDPCAVAQTLELLEGVQWAVAIRGDVRTPQPILAHPEVRRLLDLTRPVGLLLTAVLPFIPDDVQAYGAVAQLVAALPAGSYVAISHGAAETFPPDADACHAAARTYQKYTGSQATARDHAGVRRFFTGLDLVTPGVVCARQWRPESPPALAEGSGHSGLWAGVGMKS